MYYGFLMLLILSILLFMQINRYDSLVIPMFNSHYQRLETLYNVQRKIQLDT